MTAYFTDPMADEFKKALEEALKKAKRSRKEDPDASKRAEESKKDKATPRKNRRNRFSKKQAETLR